MIKTLLFDFGDVFLRLDKPATFRELKNLGIQDFTSEKIKFLQEYEKGTVSTTDFIKTLQEWYPQIPSSKLIKAWNAILLDFPQERMDFIQKLSEEGEFQLILLSNTNELHIKWVTEHIRFFQEFKACFDAFYLSHEINFRKPDHNIFEFVLEKHGLSPKEILFIDDTEENIAAAKKLGFHTWHIHPEIEDIIALFSSQKKLF